MSGLHLPAFAAAGGGLFAEQGLEVEFVDCATAPERSLRGFGATLKALASDQAEFALSSVAYLLAAQTQAGGGIGARFASVFHQRNPIVGMVATDSDLHEPDDLPGRRTAGSPGSWFVQEFAGALAHLGLEAPGIVDPPDELHAALKHGEVHGRGALAGDHRLHRRHARAVRFLARAGVPSGAAGADIDVLRGVNRSPVDIT